MLFKGQGNSWLQYRSWRNKFKSLSKRDGEHIEMGMRREGRSFIIKPFGSQMNT